MTKRWSSLLLGLLAIGVGFKAIVFQHIGSWSIHEKSVVGPAAKVVGTLLIVIGIMYLLDWLKAFRMR